MITKFRKMIAYSVSILLMLISLGLAKPNFSGEPTASSSDINQNTTLSTSIEKR